MSVVQPDRTTAFKLEPSIWKIEKIVKKGEYLYAKIPQHPNASKNGYVLHHRIVVEIHLNRLLNYDEVVHHKDGNKKNNSIGNLEVMTNTEHCREHSSRKGRRWVRLRCPSCHTDFDREIRTTFIRKNGKLKATCCSSKCRGILSRKIQLHGKTFEVERAISENILFEYVKYSKDNAEETETTGSVETICTSPETVKT